jgi:pyruvate,water dikinase
MDGDAALELSVGDAHRLEGLGISPGVVRGRTRVIRSPDEGGRLLPGEILVARATDPGWTPLFSRAGGLILELGGMLSHGAVVAREYHLPGVVNLPGVTSRLVDGTDVTVDGRNGTVWIH